jgi:hypothetical protein
MRCWGPSAAPISFQGPPMPDTETAGCCRVTEHDNSTGAERALPNMAEDPGGDTYTREQAEAKVDWRKKNITSKYSYEIRTAKPGSKEN